MTENSEDVRVSDSMGNLRTCHLPGKYNRAGDAAVSKLGGRTLNYYTFYGGDALTLYTEKGRNGDGSMTSYGPAPQL